MKKISVVFLALCVLLGVCGCQKSEQEYKAAIERHFSSKHNATVCSYESFVINSDATASARIENTVKTNYGAELNMRADVSLDSECKISSCSTCELLELEKVF